MSSQNQTAENISSPASPNISATSSRPTSFQGHARTLSMVAENGPSRSNRFSLQFPIQTNRSQSPERTPHSPIRESAVSSFEVSEPSHRTLDGNYLHLIAAQERKVLELKEELERAEAELNRLKIDWARHEASKKRDDAKRMTRLQPLHTSFPATEREDDLDGSNTWMQQEMERRKTLLSASRSTHRTVFPGQRHTRALSLLSSGKDSMNSAAANNVPQPPPRKDSLKNPPRPSIELDRPQAAHSALSRASTMSVLPDGTPQLDPEVLMRAGKKVASGLTDGLWTFWEDLRQATVGEESTAIPPPRRKSSTQTLKTAKKQGSRGSLRDSPHGSSNMSDKKRPPSPGRKKSLALQPATGLADPSFWSDHGVASSQTSAPSAVKKSTASKVAKSADTSKRQSSDSNDGWDTWDDSPVQSRSSSSVTSETATLPSTVSGSPRTSMSTNRDSRDLTQKKEAIPWPALKKSGLGTLRRTASHLLTEWERSLTPSPGHEYIGDDYMGASAEASALGAGNGLKGKND